MLIVTPCQTTPFRPCWHCTNFAGMVSDGSHPKCGQTGRLSLRAVSSVGCATRYAAGKDADALGPSDSSDSGSDVQGELSLQGEGDHADELGSLIVDTASDSDTSGTGERASATGRDEPDGLDVLPDHLIGAAGEAVESTEGSPRKRDFGELTAGETDPQDVTSEGPWVRLPRQRRDFGDSPPGAIPACLRSVPASVRDTFVSHHPDFRVTRRPALHHRDRSVVYRTDPGTPFA